MIVSKCPYIIIKDTEFITCNQIMYSKKRLGNIDQAIFRMSVYELLYTKTPHVVSINEGIVLSKKYSDEKVTNMLNAVLDKILNNE